MYLNFSIKNFFAKRNKFKSFFSFHKRLTENKYFEIECLTDSYHLLSFEFKIGFREDHAGVRITFGVLGIEIYAHIYDCRHWDYSSNCWQSNFNNLDGF